MLNNTLCLMILGVLRKFVFNYILPAQRNFVFKETWCLITVDVISI